MIDTNPNAPTAQDIICAAVLAVTTAGLLFAPTILRFLGLYQ